MTISKHLGFSSSAVEGVGVGEFVLIPWGGVETQSYEYLISYQPQMFKNSKVEYVKLITASIL